MFYKNKHSAAKLFNYKKMIDNFVNKKSLKQFRVSYLLINCCLDIPGWAGRDV